MADDRQVTVVRVAETTAWIQLVADEGTDLPLANGAVAFEHGSDERLHSVDYSRFPNIKPRDVPLGPGSSERIVVGMCAMRALFVSAPMSPEEAAKGGTVVEVDQSLIDAQDRIILPGQ